MSNNKQWHDGPPPSQGWWPASVAQKGNTYRWWNGQWWSDWATAEYTAQQAARAARKKYVYPKEIQWQHRPASWPARSKT